MNVVAKPPSVMGSSHVPIYSLVTLLMDCGKLQDCCCVQRFRDVMAMKYWICLTKGADNPNIYEKMYAEVRLEDSHMFFSKPGDSGDFIHPHPLYSPYTKNGYQPIFPSYWHSSSWPFSDILCRLRLSTVLWSILSTLLLLHTYLPLSASAVNLDLTILILLLECLMCC